MHAQDHFHLIVKGSYKQAVIDVLKSQKLNYHNFLQRAKFCE